MTSVASIYLFKLASVSNNSNNLTDHIHCIYCHPVMILFRVENTSNYSCLNVM